jgi:glycosyltransferase involved in cell wall biosynthesis
MEAIAEQRGRGLAVVIPMYDEEANAERCVRAVCARLAEELPAARLFVVNDGSSDRTPEILEALSRERLPFTRVDHGRNMGYGAALVSGARAAAREGFEYALFMDSDLTNDPALIRVFWEKLAGGAYDVVKASRYVRGGGMRGVPIRRQIPTRLGNWLASRLFGMGLRDCTNGFRAVRLSLFADLSFRERGFPMILEELLALKKRGARAAEIPYVLTARTSGVGTSKFSYRPRVVATYLKYALLAGTVRYRPVHP